MLSVRFLGDDITHAPRPWTTSPPFDGLVDELHLYVYPLAEFERIATEMTTGTTTTSRDVRDYQRVFLSGASDEVPDKQGRVTIPPVLRDYAGLSAECTVIGAGNRVEVWDSAAWTTYLSQAEPAFAERSEEVVPGLI